MSLYGRNVLIHCIYHSREAFLGSLKLEKIFSLWEANTQAGCLSTKGLWVPVAQSNFRILKFLLCHLCFYFTLMDTYVDFNLSCFEKVSGVLVFCTLKIFFHSFIIFSYTLQRRSFVINSLLKYAFFATFYCWKRKNSSAWPPARALPLHPN